MNLKRSNQCIGMKRSKSWNTKLVKVEEYHGVTECQYCQETNVTQHKN